jgi:uncharacterized protein (DUF488 family)
MESDIRDSPGPTGVTRRAAYAEAVDQPPAPMVWTIGHSTRSLADLVALLQEHRVTRLVDVRRMPHSKRHPQFDTAALARDLPAAGIDYRHSPGLGGFRTPRENSVNTAWRTPAFRGYADYMQTQDFAAHLEALRIEASTAATAVMCAEAHPVRCHRSLLADALLVRGVDVRHILGPAHDEAHMLTPDARVVDGLLSYPGQPDLFGAG